MSETLLEHGAATPAFRTADGSALPPVRVHIAFPCYADPKLGFVLDLVNLFLSSGANARARGMALRITTAADSILPRGRASLVKMALEGDATHMLWLDADMRFPGDTLFRLLDHDLPIVAANYPARRAPFQPTARRDGKWISSERASGVEGGFEGAGFGVALIRTEVFQAVEKPWFMVPYLKEADDYMGEDVYFVQKAKRTGFDVAIDHDLSRQIEHLGEIGLSFENTSRDGEVTTIDVRTPQERAAAAAFDLRTLAARQGVPIEIAGVPSLKPADALV